MTCLFCQIASGEIKSELVYEDKTVVAFKDIAPKAPVHILIIPRKHIATLNDVEHSDFSLLATLMQTAQQLAQQLKISEAGYRVLMNCNQNGGQAVYHIHLHLLGGRLMQWPPG